MSMSIARAKKWSITLRSSGGEARDGIGGEIDGVGIDDGGGRNADGSEGSGSDGAGSGATPERGLGGAFVDDQGAGCEIAEALVAAIALKRWGNDADGVEAGEGVDDADEVAGEGFEESDLAAGVADDAKLAESFCPGFGRSRTLRRW